MSSDCMPSIPNTHIDCICSTFCGLSTTRGTDACALIAGLSQPRVCQRAAASTKVHVRQSRSMHAVSILSAPCSAHPPPTLASPPAAVPHHVYIAHRGCGRANSSVAPRCAVARRRLCVHSGELGSRLHIMQHRTAPIRVATVHVCIFICVRVSLRETEATPNRTRGHHNATSKYVQFSRVRFMNSAAARRLWRATRMRDGGVNWPVACGAFT